MSPNSVAVITGGASGLGFAAAMRFARLGMKVCIADLGTDRLADAGAKLSSASPGGAANIMAMTVDVSRAEEVSGLEVAVQERFGGTDILMNNAGIQPGSQMFGPVENWQRILGVNLWGVIHGSQIFAPRMIARGRPGLIINTGSKQGITTPPGDPAYNVSKAGVKAFTEALQHELRNAAGSKISAHLFIPGFVFTGLTAKGRSEKPAAAWTPEQTVDFMIERVTAGDFYILCPDNDVPRRLDERRILWAAGDIVENRPALSRWHPDYAEAFAAFVKGGYAIGLGKRIYITRNANFRRETELIDKIGIFDTLGFEPYSNEEDLAGIILGAGSDGAIRLASVLNVKAPIYVLNTPTTGQAMLAIVSRIKRARLGFRNFFPQEEPRLSAIKAVDDISASLGVVVPLLSKDFVDADIHNIRAAFVAGVAFALGKPP